MTSWTTIPLLKTAAGTDARGRQIAAEGNNAQGVAGLAWESRIMPVRVLGDTCSGTTAGIAEALVWAVERGARVINLSLGTAFPSTLLENGTTYAYSHGAAIFAASGNSGSSIVLYPAAIPVWL
jgi:subtilisin family serine protease